MWSVLLVPMDIGFAQIRRYRVERGEVESVLKLHPDVIDPLVCPVGNRRETLDALVACPHRDGVDNADKRRFVAIWLPAHVRPSLIILIDVYLSLPARNSTAKPLRRSFLEASRLSGNCTGVGRLVTIGNIREAIQASSNAKRGMNRAPRRRFDSEAPALSQTSEHPDDIPYLSGA